MLSSQFCRYFHSGNILWQSSTKSLLAKLRQKTGYTFSNCKKALELHENDINKAEAWLHEQAQTLGWSKAQKLQGRSTKQGLVAVMVDKNHGALVEINCETDFVAKNKTFHGLAETVVAAVLRFTGDQKVVEQVNRTVLDAEAVKTLAALDGKSVADHAALAIGNIGENIQVKRALCMSVDPNIRLIGCTHPAPVNPIPASFGRYGALLAFKSPEENKLLGMQLCQHIIGMNPTKIGQQGVDEPISNVDDETTMIHQEFLLDPSLSVQQLLLGAQAEIIDFARFEMGEVIDAAKKIVEEKAQSVKTCA